MRLPSEQEESLPQFSFDTQIFGRGYKNVNCSSALLDLTGWFVFEAQILGTPAGQNRTLRRNHWEVKKEADKWKDLMLMLTSNKRPNQPLEEARVHVIRYGSRMMDFDGLVSSLKWVMDGLVLGKILKDDSWDITGPWEIDQRKSKRLEARVEIMIVGKTSSQNTQ